MRVIFYRTRSGGNPGRNYFLRGLILNETLRRMLFLI